MRRIHFLWAIVLLIACSGMQAKIDDSLFQSEKNVCRVMFYLEGDPAFNNDNIIVHWSNSSDVPAPPDTVKLLVNGEEIKLRYCPQLNWAAKLELQPGQEYVVNLCLDDYKTIDAPIIMPGIANVDFPDSLDTAEPFYFEWELDQDSDRQTITVYSEGIIEGKRWFSKPHIECYSDARSYILPVILFDVEGDPAFFEIGLIQENILWGGIIDFYSFSESKMRYPLNKERPLHIILRVW